jgi:energy-coupling factor transporter ATP-binding protein EcfA2
MANHPAAPDPAWRCVLLSGPSGSGKTTVCRLGHHAMLATWGQPAAALDVDQLYFNVDARWELPYDNRRNAMVLTQAAHLVISLFAHGWRTVMICGNSLFEPADTAPILATLCPSAQIYHVTLAPDPAAVLRRCATMPGRDPSRLAAGVDLQARKVHPGSARLDNTNLTPEQTLAEIARLVDAGTGRLPCSA